MFDFTQNYFALFDLEPMFEIDLGALSQRYRVIQNQVHPDKFAGKSDQDQRLAVQYTSFVNEAYLCLKQPLERAKYLLRLKGVDINLDVQSHFDSEFLMAQMELREQLESVAAQKDPEAGIKSLEKKIDEKINELSMIFLSTYKPGDNKAALDAVVKWQFLVKLQHDVKVLEDSFF